MTLDAGTNHETLPPDGAVLASPRDERTSSRFCSFPLAFTLATGNRFTRRPESSFLSSLLAGYSDRVFGFHSVEEDIGEGETGATDGTAGSERERRKRWKRRKRKRQKVRLLE